MSRLSSIVKIAAKRLRSLRSIRDVRKLAALVASFAFLRPYYSIRIRMNTRHVSGPRRLSGCNRGVIVLCLVRDGSFYIKEFIKHYRVLGVQKIVLMDNGSTDHTIEIASAFDNVIVLRCTLPFGIYKNHLRRYLLYRFGKNRWSISVDIDEFFDYPFSDRITLEDLTRYLDANRYTAVVTYMLDVFPKTALRVTWKDQALDWRKSMRFYDLGNVQSHEYTYQESGRHNNVSNPAIPLRRGGIRQEIFHVDVLITKHSLLRMDGRVRPLPPHEVTNAKIADITCTVLHYKFGSDFERQIRRALDERGYAGKSRHYEHYERVLREQPYLSMNSTRTRELKNINNLIDDGFLIVSPAYESWVRARETCGDRGDERR